MATAATNLSWRSGVQRKRALAASAAEYVTGGDVPKEGPGLPSDAVSGHYQCQQGQVMVAKCAIFQKSFLQTYLECQKLLKFEQAQT